MAKRRKAVAVDRAPAAKTAINPQASLAPSHDAAGTGRRLRGWQPSGTGPNRANAGAATIRNRARDAVRNDWAARAIIQRWSSSLVGTGIMARPKTADPAFKARLVQLWEDWMRVADADGVLDFYGMQSLAVESWKESGEIFIRLRPRLPADGLPVPLQVQLLEADMVPSTDSTAPNGNAIVQGIEFNRIGTRVAYWMLRNHPGDGRGDTGTLVRVPAEYVIHLYKPTRPGQLRGVSELANVIAKLRGVADFDDAVLERQKLANLFAGFVERPSSGGDTALDPLTGQPVATDSDGTPMAALEPGTMQELLPGEKVNFSDPPDAGANYADFTRSQYQGIAAGTGMPYELVTGDLRDVSDRSLRLMLTEFRRICQQQQWHMLIPMLCQGVRNAWADAAMIAGILTGDEAAEAKRVTWVPQGWDYIHPTQDVQARKMAVEAGFTSRSRVITERGDDPEEIDSERAADYTRASELGLIVEPVPVEIPEDPLATALLEGQRSLGTALASLAAREQPAPQLTVQLPGPGKPTMKVGKRMADGSVEIREVEIEGAGDAD